MATATEPTGAPPTETPAAPPSTGTASPPSGGEIHVVPQPVEPTTPPKAGTARERMRQELRKKAGAGTQGQAQAPSPEPTPTPPAPQPQPTEPPAATPTEPTTTPSTGEPQARAGKANPWKLLDTYKTKAGQLEKEIADLRAGAVTAEQRQAFEKRIDDYNKRITELENEIRFANYSASEECRQKYDQPLEKAFARAMQDLGELVITDETTDQTRRIGISDILKLVNKPLGEARELAVQLFGDFADDVMAHRKEIRGLMEARHTALEEAKKNGAERDKARLEETQRQSRDIQDFVVKEWQKAQEEVLADKEVGHFLKPVDGDDERNSKLEQGYGLFDKWSGINPTDPRLTPQQRAEATRAHAAIRNRSAAWGVLRHLIAQRDQKIADLEKVVAQFKGSVPGSTGRAPAAPPAAETGSAMDRMKAALRAKARNY